MNLEDWKLITIITFLGLLHPIQSDNFHVIADPGGYYYNIEVRRSQNGGDRWSVENEAECTSFRFAKIKDSKTCTCPIERPHFFSREGEDYGCYASEEIDQSKNSCFLFMHVRLVLTFVGHVASLTFTTQHDIRLYFECRINKKRTPSDRLFGEFAHWVCVFGRIAELLYSLNR